MISGFVDPLPIFPELHLLICCCGNPLPNTPNPCSRDSKGYNNGFFILGYRIYVNDMPQMSVDGAMTCQAKIPCPTSAPRQPIRLDVRYGKSIMSYASYQEIPISMLSILFDLCTVLRTGHVQWPESRPLHLQYTSI